MKRQRASSHAFNFPLNSAEKHPIQNFIKKYTRICILKYTHINSDNNIVFWHTPAIKIMPVIARAAHSDQEPAFPSFSKIFVSFSSSVAAVNGFTT